ncbi:MAG TPA: hypothetical protein ENK57_00975 [Polyangiaceae bacterium]|nr:hypothetical protein [Polyangiaceae bacterium]
MATEQITPPSDNGDRTKVTWTPHRVRQLAVLAGVDPRTARRWLARKPVTSTCAARLSDAAHTLEAGRHD